MKKGSEYESIIAEIYKKIEPHAIITKNDKIIGLDSKTEREIDLSIRSNIASHEVLVIVQAKDYKNKVDINIIGSFASVIRDVRASKGILICNSGFTKGAVKLANNLGIDLCNIHDAKSRNWNLDLKLPVVRIDRKIYYVLNYQARLPEEDIMPNGTKITMPISCHDPCFSIDDGKTFFPAIDIFIDLFLKNKIKYSSDEQILEFYNESENNDNIFLKLVINNDLLIPINYAIIKYRIWSDYYLKYVSPEEFIGLKNLSTNKFTVTNLKLDFIDNSVNKDKQIYVDETWKKLDDLNTLAIEPIYLLNDQLFFMEAI